jgi:hypothetical protein
VLNFHSVEELIGTLKLLELNDLLVVCYYWKQNCYACHRCEPFLTLKHLIRHPTTKLHRQPIEPLACAYAQPPGEWCHEAPALRSWFSKTPACTQKQS